MIGKNSCGNLDSYVAIVIKRKKLPREAAPILKSAISWSAITAVTILWKKPEK
jgi:hypothetical protein